VNSGTASTESTDDNTAAPTESAEPTDGEFSGSSTPAGPDLTTGEEQDVISSGWK